MRQLTSATGSVQGIMAGFLACGVPDKETLASLAASEQFLMLAYRETSLTVNDDLVGSNSAVLGACM